MPSSTKNKPKPKTKVPAHYKKRVAGHHRQTTHYAKAYWPYLPMLFIAVLGIAFSNLWGSPGGVLGSTSELSSQTLLEGTNGQRANSNQAQLTIDTKLTEAAQAKAIDMAQRNYWSHNAPDGKAPWNFIANAGYGYETAGENLAYGFSSSSETITGWMNSPEHRANILNNSYKNVGFGIVNAKDFQGKPFTTIVVAMYASPRTSVANITFDVAEAGNVAGVNDVREPSTRFVSRLALLSGNQSSWTTFIVIALTSIGVIVFAIHNAYRLHRLLNRGEHFISKHPILDITVVAVITVGLVVTQSSGAIR